MGLSEKQKNSARSSLSKAVKLGKVLKPKECERCGAKQPFAHHPDHSKPLEVIWLCGSCHNEEHHPSKERVVRKVLWLAESQIKFLEQEAKRQKLPNGSVLLRKIITKWFENK